MDEKELIERMARAGYESKQWKHKWPWERNSYAQEAWRACARDMLSAVKADLPLFTLNLEKSVGDDIA